MKKILIPVLALLVSACSGLKTNYDYNPDVSFKEYTSYAWIEPKTNDENTYHLNGLMDQRVKEAVNNELKAKGLTLVDKQQADLFVIYLTKIEKKVNVETFNTQFGYYPYPIRHVGDPILDQRTVVNEYEVGTLIIDLVDRKTGQLVWRGSVAKTIDESKTPEDRIKKVNAAVNKVLSNYPPQTASK